MARVWERVLPYTLVCRSFGPKLYGAKRLRAVLAAGELGEACED